MKNQILVTVGREHGSGGHYIARLVADQLGIQLYDRELVEGTVATSGYNKDFVREMDEKPVNVFLARRIGNYSNSLEENVAKKAFDFIHRRAEHGESFVVVGRCGEYVLRDYPCVLRLFIRGDWEDKLQRIMETDHMTESQAAKAIRDTDRKRKAYHNYYCDSKWGDCRGYDLVVNSGTLGINKTSIALVRYIRDFMEL